MSAEIAQWTMTTLDDIFQHEARDDAWAASREAEIRKAKSDKRLAGVTSIDAECRRSMCRVVVGLEPATARRTLQALTVTPPLNTTGFHGIDPDDDHKIRMFVSKEGTSLMENPALREAWKARDRG